MTARFSWNQRNTRSQTALQFGSCNFPKLSPTFNCTPGIQFYMKCNQKRRLPDPKWRKAQHVKDCRSSHQHIAVGVQDGEYTQLVAVAFSANAKFQVQRWNADAFRLKLRTAKTVVVAGAGPRYEYFYDPTRAESALARNAVDDALQRAAGRRDLAGTG